MIEKGADLYVYDPYFLDKSNTKSLDEILDKSFAILIATNHNIFTNLNSETLIKHNIKIVIDGKNCLDKKDILNAGLYYKGIGT